MEGWIRSNALQTHNVSAREGGEGRKREGRNEGKLGAINSQNNNTIVLCSLCRSLASDLT